MKSAITLVAALFLALPAMASERGHAAHHPNPKVAAASTVPDQGLQALQERMREIRDATDPESRLRLMDEQLAAMGSMLNHMQGMDGGTQGKGTHHNGMGDKGPGMLQRGPGGGMNPAMMGQRSEMMQRCMEMMH
jgi:hypothetical protein